MMNKIDIKFNLADRVYFKSKGERITDNGVYPQILQKANQNNFDKQLLRRLSRKLRYKHPQRTKTLIDKKFKYES